ncbi:zinc ABC transporter substrate-binding protein [Agrobacterium sp. SHOUNA12C]|uniref:High-affinity zinc uptake system protein ZnuA n=2 Tax=Rhizobium rhizogenes TaxID=359 RepID=B9JGA7_RHIR8|nr:zinc ABC transporter substrate-binding protein [Rhizobium rhizogenes]ACM26882.1 zinc uptake ABC transporter [Rhizobium rhizogenes K84]KAA6489881.1 zinc ABC transporter substrate-binding protein [Agrobacterium sp. ICMP 7243]MCJ9723706.1 zinc ABC transporter substrate-binding protein [Agrobacterium sp. BETTINA12B]MCJ9759165.1 zinc ABC transporter substrate-binding protein [Agrobacterium sp. SHOUNA12C]OCJ25951.1 zinc ABC transporter substrate-binding protein [Agrobacterium sp. B131/95]OCJ3095
MTIVKSFLPLTASLLFSGFFASATMAADAPDVVVSIKPIHSLVAAIMDGVGTPELIVDGAASPHTYALKPSNAKALEAAKVVFWVGPGMETFLEKPLSALGANALVVELDKAPGITKLKFREGGAFEADDDGDEPTDHDHDHGEFDTHLWLDPHNAKAMTAEITTTLVAADPANALTYEANQKALDDRLDALDAEIASTLAPVKSKPFIVFHDAYQYFERRYGVRVAGSITVSPESIPGAQRISEIHGKVAELGATCVFAEPQFEPKLVNVVLEGTSAKSGVLDPEAATLPQGPDLYFDLMRGIANSLKTCLS